MSHVLAMVSCLSQPSVAAYCGSLRPTGFCLARATALSGEVTGHIVNTVSNGGRRSWYHCLGYPSGSTGGS